MVTFEEGQALAKEFKIPFMETSAMNDINVEEAFMKISKDVYSRLESDGGKASILKGGKAANKNGPKSLSSADYNSSEEGKKGGWC